MDKCWWWQSVLELEPQCDGFKKHYVDCEFNASLGTAVKNLFWPLV